jgi:homoserine dehydrogenase
MVSCGAAVVAVDGGGYRVSVAPIGVGLLGLGTVGTAVARAIAEQEQPVMHRLGRPMRVAALFERGPERAARADLPPDLVQTDGAAVVDDPGVQIIVEVLGGEEPAHELIERALRAGKPVVTANKETLAKHGGALFPLAAARRVPLLCEASVGGGIPLFAALRQVQAANAITAFRGIINGTTNFILSAMAERGTSYGDALAEAQRLGYAEPDPTADVEGFDATYKACVLAQACFGVAVSPDTVARTGITGVSAEEIADARASGEVIKLLAQGSFADGNVSLAVAPARVAAGSLLGATTANYNAIELTGDRVGPVLLVGQGAGPRPTASAILSDIVDAARVILGAPPEPYFIRLGGVR